MTKPNGLSLSSPSLLARTSPGRGSALQAAAAAAAAVNIPTSLDLIRLWQSRWWHYFTVTLNSAITQANLQQQAAANGGILNHNVIVSACALLVVQNLTSEMAASLACGRVARPFAPWVAHA